MKLLKLDFKQIKILKRFDFSKKNECIMIEIELLINLNQYSGSNLNNMEIANLYAAKETASLALSITTTSKEEVHTNGTMEDATRETGRTTK